MPRWSSQEMTPDGVDRVNLGRRRAGLLLLATFMLGYGNPGRDCHGCKLVIERIIERVLRPTRAAALSPRMACHFADVMPPPVQGTAATLNVRKALFNQPINLQRNS